jgi:trehalose-6-phosphatase
MTPKNPPAAPKEVLAIEYDGTLYRTVREAEEARATKVLTALLPPIQERYDGHWYVEATRQECIRILVKNRLVVLDALARIPGD